MTDQETGEPSATGTPVWQPQRFEASTTGGGSIFQAGRDLHVHELDEGRTTVPGPGADAVLCPYPGLAPFGAEHRQWFHGRERMVHTVCERMDARMREGGPLVLIGPSGSGKSSLLAAGVLPALDAGRLPVAGSSSWPRLVMTPTAAPALALAAAAGLDSDAARHAAPTWRSDPAKCLADLCEITTAGVAAPTGAAAEAPSGTVRAAGLVVVVDQFEELFTACGDEAERQWFVELLDRLARAGGEAVVVLGVRADFYAACTAYPQLRAALQAGPVLLEPMTEDELKEVIRRPARNVGLGVEDGLVELLLADLGAAGDQVGVTAVGRLPLLAHALRATWQQRHGHTLTVDGYRITGGIQRAIATTADRLHAALPPACRDAARRVFLRLVIVGRDADDTRRRVRYDDLLRHAPDRDAAARVVDDFTRGRLLTRDRDTVVMTHEVLIRTWPRLRDWIERDRTGNLVRQDLEEAAEGWERADRDTAALYRGNRLEIALTWAGTHGSDLSAAAAAFLAASRHHQRRGQRLRRAAVTVITVLAMVASVTAVFAFQQESRARAAAARALRARNQAIDAAVTSESQQLAATDPSLSAQLALTAYRMNPTPEAASRLITTENTPLDIRLPGPAGSVYTVAYSPDGHTLAAGNVNQNLVRLWDVSDPSHPVALGRPVPEDPAVDSVLSLAFSPDGRVLAVAGHTTHNGDSGSGGFVDLWNLTSPSHPVLLGRPKDAAIAPGDAATSVESLAFSPDGRTLAVGWHAGLVSLWNVTRPDDVTPEAQPLDLGCPGVYAFSLAFTPDGRTLASACDDDSGTISLWDTAHPARPAHLGRSLTAGRQVESLAFSPDGRTLAAGGSDSDVHLWTVTDPNRPTPLGKPLTGPAQPVMSVAFSPDGHVLAAGSADHTIHLWNVSDTGVITPLGRPLTRPGDAVAAVAFSPDSRTLAAANTDGGVDLWNLPRTQVAGGGGNVASVAFSPDGRTLAEGNQNATVTLWNTADPDHPAPRGDPLAGSGHPFDAVAFSPDGQTLAAGDGRGTVTLWNTADPNHPDRLPHALTASHAAVFSLAFSPDGHTLAAALDDLVYGEIALFDVSDPANPQEQGDVDVSGAKSVQSVAFSPDGSVLAAGGDGSNGTVGLWSTTDPGVRIGEPIPEPSATSTWVALSPDGRTLAAGNSHGTVTLWNTADPNHPVRRGRPLTVPGGSMWSVAFSKDGRTLAAAGHTDQGTITRWNVTDPDRPVPVGQPLSVATGYVAVLAFSPDGHTLAATTDDGVATLWDLNVEAAITHICTDSAGALTSQQWARYVPQLPYTPPCSGASATAPQAD